MKMKWTALLLLMMAGFAAKAQYPYITQYTKNYFLVNPAVAGLDSSSQLLFWNRNNITTNQNLRFSSIQLGYHTPIQQNSAGLGLKFSVDKPLYAFNRDISSLSGNYAYNVQFSEDADIRIGLGLGIHRISRDIQTGVAQGRLTDYLFYYDFGMIFDFGNAIIGVSAASVNNPRTDRNGGGSLNPPVSIGRVVTLMGKYNYDYSEYVTLTPSILLRNDGFGGEVSLELKGEAELWNTFLVGAGYRFTRFGQLEINPPFPYTNYKFPDYFTLQAGGYISDLIFVTLSYDTPVNTNITAPPSLIEGTVGLGL